MTASESVTYYQKSFDTSRPAWGDAQIARFSKRVAIFRRRGWATDRAEAFADMLAARDYSRDDRRACIECKGLQRDGACLAAKQGRLGGAITTRYAPVPDMLQRCPGFVWMTA